MVTGIEIPAHEDWLDFNFQKLVAHSRISATSFSLLLSYFLHEDNGRKRVKRKRKKDYKWRRETDQNC